MYVAGVKHFLHLLMKVWACPPFPRTGARTGFLLQLTWLYKMDIFIGNAPIDRFLKDKLFSRRNSSKNKSEKHTINISLFHGEPIL